MSCISAYVFVLMVFMSILVSSCGRRVEYDIQVVNYLPDVHKLLQYRFREKGRGTSNNVLYKTIPYDYANGVAAEYEDGREIHFNAFLSWTEREDEDDEKEIIKYGQFDLFNTSFIPYPLQSGGNKYVWHARDFGLGLCVEHPHPHYAIGLSWITTSRAEYERRIISMSHSHQSP